MQILAETNFRESFEFLHAQCFNLFTFSFLIGFFACISLLLLFSARLGRLFGSRLVRGGLLLLLAGGYVMLGYDAKAWVTSRAIFPFNNDLYLSCENFVFGWQHYRAMNANDLEALVAATERIGQTDISSSFASPDVVVVIGESFSKHHSSLYGYPVATNPLLERRRQTGNLFAFDDAVTPWNYTSAVLKAVFASLPEHRKTNNSWGDAPIFPAVFKASGYRTFFISNQIVRTSGYMLDFYTGYYLNNRIVDRASFDGRNASTYAYDEGLLDAFEVLKSGLEAHNLVVFHLMGQHVDYEKRCPPEHVYFTTDSIGRPDLPAVARQQIADYDNATRYNDFVVDQIIRRFESRDAGLLYFSDHGEEVNDYRIKINRSQGNSPHEIRYQYEVPFFVWVSDTYKKTHPETVARIAAAVNRPFMTDGVSQLLFDLAGIESPWTCPKESVIDEGYERRPRLLRGGTCVYEEVMKNDAAPSRRSE